MDEKTTITVGLTLTREEADDIRAATKIDALAPAVRVAVREKIAIWKGGER